jgi:predicted enzyme related to lactoylglutathione lyase
VAKATGLGGAFVRVSDPKALYAWYETNLGVNAKGGFIMFPQAELREYSLVTFFKKDSDYFPVAQPVMLNLQVDDLAGVLEKLRAAGADVDPKVEDTEYGKFGWFKDPEGNRVELFQPPAEEKS